MSNHKVLVCAFSAALLFATQSLTAQAPSDRDWSLSLLGGIGSARLSAGEQNAPFETASLGASSLGVQLAWRLTERWGVSAGLVGASRGSRSTTIDEFGRQPEVEIRTLYRDIPLLAHFTLRESPALRIDAVAGPVFSWSVSGDVFLRQTGQQVAVVDLNERETSVLVGAEAAFAMRLPLFVRLQYQAGLTDASVGQSLNSRMFSAVAGVTLLRW